MQEYESTQGSQVFKSKDELLNWVREVGKRNGLVIVIKTSDYGGGKKRPKMYLACERSGQYRVKKKLKHDDNNTSRTTGTKKCGCPFDMRAHRFTTNDEWTLTVVYELHNHPPAEHLEGHSYAGRLSKDEKALLIDMSKSMVRPKEILVTLKQRDAPIYNVRHRNRVIQRVGRLQIQHLLGELAKYNYIELHRCEESTMTVTDLFWAHSTSLDLFLFFPDERLKSLLTEFSSYPDAVNYVIDTWLVPYKEKFVAAWTDTCMYCGNVTTNLVESAHAKLKRQLGSCQISFQASFEKIHSLLEFQHIDIKASFEKSLTVVQHQFKPSQFRELQGNMSIFALEYLLVESKRANSISIHVEACGCVLHHTYGLPCAYEIADYIRQYRPIPLATIHSQWRQLHISICKKEEETEMSCHAQVELFVNKFNESDRTMRLELLKKLKNIVYSGSTFFVEPEVKPKTRHRDHKKINVSTRHDPCAFEFVQSGHDSFSPRDTQITTLASTLQTKKKRPVKGKEKVNPKGKAYITRTVKPGAYVDAFLTGLKPYIKFVKDQHGPEIVSLFLCVSAHRSIVCMDGAIAWVFNSETAFRPVNRAFSLDSKALMSRIKFLALFSPTTNKDQCSSKRSGSVLHMHVRLAHPIIQAGYEDEIRHPHRLYQAIEAMRMS
ncbi:uncharacterized protein LOC114273835 [Camellia sinensis]|uniref:uncharacterized protein LOC114273835 n=1 Tax=Camellia sinensis TaxID=4442 RepID=UPI00103671C6|nr:uncharacterized protein LOC114273835 [Camellia sinensis]